MPEDVLSSEPLRFALEIISARETKNYIRFFKLVKRTTYLNCCILRRYFSEMRAHAFATMVRAFCSQRLTSVAVCNFFSSYFVVILLETISLFERNIGCWSLSIFHTSYVRPYFCLWTKAIKEISKGARDDAPKRKNLARCAAVANFSENSQLPTPSIAVAVENLSLCNSNIFTLVFQVPLLPLVENLMFEGLEDCAAHLRLCNLKVEEREGVPVVILDRKAFQLPEMAFPLQPSILYIQEKKRALLSEVSFPFVILNTKFWIESWINHLN